MKKRFKVAKVVGTLAAALGTAAFAGGADGGVFTNAIAGLNGLQTQLLVLAVAVAVVVFTAGAIAKSGGLEWGQRAMFSSVIGLVLAGAAVTVIGLFA